jgi:hypothetical protein
MMILLKIGMVKVNLGVKSNLMMERIRSKLFIIIDRTNCELSL